MAEVPNVYAGVSPEIPFAAHSDFFSQFIDSTAFTKNSTANNSWIVLINTWGEAARSMTGYTRVNHMYGWNVLKADGSAQYYLKSDMESISNSTSQSNAFWSDK